MKTIKTLPALREAIAAGAGLYVRWCRGPALDKRRGGSRDYVAGREHGAWSAVPVNPDWAADDAYMIRRVGEYGFLRIKDQQIAPYLYAGRTVGMDSDGYALIADICAVAKIAPELLD